MRVLDTVFSVLVLADHTQRDRELLVLLATDEFLEGGLVAVAGELTSTDSAGSPVRPAAGRGGVPAVAAVVGGGDELVGTGRYLSRLAASNGGIALIHAVRSWHTHSGGSSAKEYACVQPYHSVLQ
jgi:hypothetical protein